MDLASVSMPVLALANLPGTQAAVITDDTHPVFCSACVGEIGTSHSSVSCHARPCRGDDKANFPNKQNWIEFAQVSSGCSPVGYRQQIIRKSPVDLPIVLVVGPKCLQNWERLTDLPGGLLTSRYRLPLLPSPYSGLEYWRLNSG